jgi:ribosome biogenesis SPOUT family RNA methylase Rps3
LRKTCIFISVFVGPHANASVIQVTSLVIDQGKELDKIHYIDHPTITFNKQESVEMPFRYVVNEATQGPTMPKGMKALLYEDMNKGFDI